MGVNNLATEMRVEDLPGDLPAIAEIIGVEKTLEVWRAFSGSALRFPSKFPRDFCARYIRNKFNGSNRLKLCQELGIGEKTFRNLLNTKGHFAQTDLFVSG